MASNAKPEEVLSPVKRALLEIHDLRAQLALSRQRVPVAIVGVGVRLPGGVSDAASFEQLLWSGTDVITEIPASRWSLDTLYAADPDTPGKMTTRFGAFLHDVDKFDAEFFGISPREAASMDPQQRLMLQVAWEALENAGQAGGDLAGSRTGVFVGVANNDYGRAIYAHPELIDAYFSTGNALSVVAGRLSYFLGVHGPSIAIDTACSSSLVALHLACQSLQQRECDRAVAGGVNLILTPEMNINFSKARMMAPDGRCKTFDASADGYVRGEGCGVVVLKRLSEAEADGDRILAVIRGSAINQDGRSGGLTAPNGPAQESVIRAALDSARISGRQVSYVEAHGTGTPLGDPIEVGAIGAALCEERDAASPLMIGSVKTNLGHLEAAAGITGVIKVVLAMQREEIPPHLHFATRSPHIAWDDLAIKVPTVITPWSAIDGRRIAGVSSFGFSGTNAHVVLESPPAVTQAKATTDVRIRERPLHLLPLSARDAATLHELAGRYAMTINPDAPAADICYSAAVGRTHFAKRLAVIARDSVELQQLLQEHVAGRTSDAAVTSSSDSVRPQVAFLFTGQGAQHPGMGRELYDTSPVFRAALDRCAAGLRAHLDRDLLELMHASPDDAAIHETRYAQPVNFALEYALAELWRSLGIVPAAVMGHSLGEYAAACVAGLIPLEDALRLVAERGRLTSLHALAGAMGTVFANEAAVRKAIKDENGAVEIAAINGPEQLVVSGQPDAVARVLSGFEARGVRVKALRVPHGAHSAQIDPVLAPFRAVLDTVRFSTPHTPLFSNVTGEYADDALQTSAYWLEHMRQPVKFAQTMGALAAQGITHFIEIGPHPVLLGMGSEAVTESHQRWLPSLRRERGEWQTMMEALQQLYVDGAEIDWRALDRGHARSHVALPTYPFRQRSHWMDVVGTPAVQGPRSDVRMKRVHDAVSRQAGLGPLELNASSYPAKWACLARVTMAHAVDVLRSAGVFVSDGERHSLAGVLTRASIGDSYKHLVQRWLDRLVGAGALLRHDDLYVSTRALLKPDLTALWQEAEQLFTDNRALLAYVRHCGTLVGPVLRGEESPLETLFPGGSSELATALYEHSATMRYVNDIAAAAFRTLGEMIPGGRVMRVMEVGAGTGGTTASLLPVLPSDRVQYVYSDVSDLFLERAQERFSQYPFVQYARFDMELAPDSQGFADGSFDVIVSANAVHASKDMRQTLARLRALLAPGGTLVLVESTTHLAWFDMTTGLIEGWQHFVDDLRTDNPLLAPDVWMSALHDAGFTAARAWPDVDSPAAHLGQHVLIASVPGDEIGGTATYTKTTSATSGDASDEMHVVHASSEAPPDMRQQVLVALPGDRLEVVREFVRERVMRVLRLGAEDAPGRNDRLMDLGFDSLMAVQLRNNISKGLGLTTPLPATLLFDYPTIDVMAAHLLQRLIPVEVAPPAINGSVTIGAPSRMSEADVADLSDADIEALLIERMGRA